MKPQTQNRFLRHPKRTLATVLLFLALVISISVEITLRQMGFEPGKVFRNHLYQPVNTLTVYSGYEADSDGILKCSAKGREQVSQIISQTSKLDEHAVWENTEMEYCHKQLAIDFQKLAQNGEQTFNRFAQLTMSADAPDSMTLALHQYIQSPINNEGFRSLPFQKFGSSKKTVLLIGDSFVWGLSAKPLYECFADRLLAMGYVVYNAGIVCADPAQYAAIARKYIPILKPDVVIVNFFVGNDVMFFPRETVAGQFPYYPTNAGWLRADPLGEYLKTPEAAYAFVKRSLFVTENDNSWAGKLAAQTVVGTKLWYLFAKWTNHLPPEMETYDEQRFNVGKKSVAENYIIEIQKIAEQNNVRFELAVIPEFQLRDQEKIKAKLNFSRLIYHLPKNLTPADYSTQRDAHLNNHGHKKYAEFLKKIIETKQ